MDRLQELAVLVAVIDHGSLAAAARRLRRSPPGALTIRHGTEVIGAIAVSGSAGQDEACARAGLSTLAELLKVSLDGR
jgi:hypothetical protein